MASNGRTRSRSTVFLGEVTVFREGRAFFRGDLGGEISGVLLVLLRGRRSRFEGFALDRVVLVKTSSDSLLLLLSATWDVSCQ